MTDLETIRVRGQAAAEKRHRLAGEIRDTEEALAKMVDRVHLFQDEDDVVVCPTCYREIPEEYRRALLLSSQKQLALLEGKHDALLKKADALQNELDELKESYRDMQRKLNQP